MKATVMRWDEVEPGSTVVMQGTLMKFLREADSTKVEQLPELRALVLEFEGHEMYSGVYNEWLVAVVDDA
jgi:hypothetical protein